MAAHSKLLQAVTPRNSALFTAASIVAFLLYKQAVRKPKTSTVTVEEEVKVVIAQHGQKKEKAVVNSIFFARLGRILKILIPGLFTVESLYLVMVAVSLVARTFADVWMIQNGTSIESAIIGRDAQQFKMLLLKFIYAMPAISLVNNLLKFGLNMLKLRFRIRLSTHLYDKYLKGFTFYKMSNLDNRIANADQLLTQDTEKFCDSVAELYSNLSKPILDVILYTIKLTGAIGIMGPTYMLMYLAVSGLLLTHLRRPIGRMTMVEQKLEGEYRYVNSRLITNSEEIAFYQGNNREKFIITGSFHKLVDHLRSFIYFRIQMGFVDNIIAKYVATVVGYLVVSRPFLNLAHPRHLTSTHSERLEDYFKSGRMLVKMAEAIGRIVLAGRELTRLAGFTARVTELMKVLSDLNAGRYERTMVNIDNGKASMNNQKQLVLKPGSGNIIIKDYIIKFDKVPLVTPNGDVLIEELSFEVSSGKNVLVCGPNGCGKSSLFRILGELWPLFGGTLTKPEKGKLFYVPQRPYMAVGTLRDQVIYPDNHTEQLKKGVRDEQLADILNKVQLGHILDREGGWDSVQIDRYNYLGTIITSDGKCYSEIRTRIDMEKVAFSKDWMDVLSGGEKQRIAMARLFYHKPQFAILDECTSAVSVDVEGFMYQHSREVGITLFTVSHRKSLWKHHEYYLKMDGRGYYEFKPITDDTTEFGS